MKIIRVKRWGSLFIEVNLLQKIKQTSHLHARVRVFLFQESLQPGDLYKYTCTSDDYFAEFKSVSLTWVLEHLTWMGCRSTWRQTTKECLPSEPLCCLWDVTANVEVQPIGSNRLRLLCCPNNVYRLNWLRLIVHGKASPSCRRERRKNIEKHGILMLAESVNAGMSAEQLWNSEEDKEKCKETERRCENVRAMDWNIKIRWKIKNTKGDITSCLKHPSQEIHVLPKRGRWERSSLTACQPWQNYWTFVCVGKIPWRTACPIYVKMQISLPSFSFKALVYNNICVQ